MSQTTLPLVFLVGCSRSGTTLLQSLLAAHPAIWSLPETKFFYYANPCHEPKRQALGLVSRRLKPSLVQLAQDIQQPRLVEGWPPFPVSLGYGTRRFFGTLQRLTQEQGKQVFLEKTPEHFRQLALIDRHLPQAKVIHLVRHGADVAASLYDLGQRYPRRWGKSHGTLEDCLSHWREAIAATQQYQSHPQHCVVRYDRLVANPSQTLRTLCEFLGLSFSPQMLEDYQQVGPGLVRPHEQDYKARSSQAIEPQGLSKFHQVFDPAQQVYVRTALADYDLDRLFPDA